SLSCTPYSPQHHLNLTHPSSPPRRSSDLIGTHTVSATYDGNLNFGASNPSATINQIVNVNTSTALSSSQNPSTFGQGLTFTATVITSPPVYTTLTRSAPMHFDATQTQINL